MRLIIPAFLCAALVVPTAFGQESAPASTSASSSQDAALRLVQTITLPDAVKGNFDHFGIDLKRNRLFATPEDFKAVLVFDLNSGKLIHQIDGIARPHAIFYREDTDRLYVTDGGDGSLKVYDGETYNAVNHIPLLKDADSIGYDISRKYLYIDNGGGDIGKTYSMLSGVDTTSGKKIVDIKIDGDTLEAMALDNYRPRIYVNDKAKNTVVVVNRFKNEIVATWPITKGRTNVAMALDEQRQRLFVGCRSGQIVVLDTNTGKELQTLPIAQNVDDVVYDPLTRRLYAIGGGTINVFDQTDLDHYVSAGAVVTGSKAKTARLVPQINRYFAAAPQDGAQPARVLIYEPVNTKPGKTPTVEPQIAVNAPTAERIILETLSAHPDVRKMGLHTIPPGQENMVITANGNETRLGIRTTAGDFAAVKDGKTYCAKIDDGAFYNIKMQMFDADGRRIGILVMEIPYTSAATSEDAIRMAESLRKEVSQKIPSLESLFGHA